MGDDAGLYLERDQIKNFLLYVELPLFYSSFSSFTKVIDLPKKAYIFWLYNVIF